MKNYCVFIFVAIMVSACSQQIQIYRKKDLFLLPKPNDNKLQTFELLIHNSLKKNIYFHDYFYPFTLSNLKNGIVFSNLPTNSSVEYPIELTKIKPGEQVSIHLELKEPFDTLLMNFSYLTNIEHCNIQDKKRHGNYLYTTTMCFFNSYDYVVTVKKYFKLE